MFQGLQPAPPDAILGLSEAFQRDDRPDKINLTVGVYKDASGVTPTLECVRAAEAGPLPDDLVAEIETLGQDS